jgi:hypothetical protein
MGYQLDKGNETNQMTILAFTAPGAKPEWPGLKLPCAFAGLWIGFAVLRPPGAAGDVAEWLKAHAWKVCIR